MNLLIDKNFIAKNPEGDIVHLGRTTKEAVKYSVDKGYDGVCFTDGLNVSFTNCLMSSKTLREDLNKSLVQ